MGLAYLAEHKARHRPVHPCLVAVGRAICRSATAVQRKEPADAAGPTSGQRHQADTQPGSQCRHECQQCVGQLTTVLLPRARGPRTTGPLWPDGLESTQSSRSTGDSADIEPDRAAQRWFACAPEFGSHQAAKPRTDQAILAKERGPSGRPLRYAVRTAAFSRSSPCWATSAARLP